MKTVNKYMRPHKTCPYFDLGEGKCSRTGCMFLTPCTAVNEPHNMRTFVKIIRQRNSGK